ncbi:helix-hairpin-helix motif [Trichococcus palustris]|jgi:competence protein ComEA|uniref:Helix-hairpin-helix motif n=1 Tax=Trichococcus palustris TaxID=140314 RepID=A0A143Y879_9LACT|nr:helix-hairpin-helix motif [Trichococcus palustris]SFK67329.1 competence protein ComEA [Trichococcus palustris]
MSHCDIRVLDRLGHSVSLIRAERTRSAFLASVNEIIRLWRILEIGAERGDGLLFFKDWIRIHQKLALLLVTGVLLLFGILGFALLAMGSEGEDDAEELLLDQTYLAESGKKAVADTTASLPGEGIDSGTDVIVVVDIKGAVQNPGVYQGDENMRVVDMIALAGGLLETADDRAVNLAQRITDQMVIYIPTIGEDPGTVADGNEVSQQYTGTEGETGSEKVNINTADAAQLQTLTGIGEKKAELIIAYRKENGSFQTIEDIMEVSGIGEKTFEGFKEAITVGSK